MDKIFYKKKFVKMDKKFEKERLWKWTRYLIKMVCKNGQDIW